MIKMYTVILAIISAGVCSTLVSAQETKLLSMSQTPEFHDFEAVVHRGNIARPRLTRDPEIQNFRTRIVAASGKAPNFAGHYHLVIWGCGAGCRMGAVIDVKSGQVTMLPYAVAGSFDFRKNSRLLVMNGSRNESEEDNESDQHFYEMSGTKLLYLGTRR